MKKLTIFAALALSFLSAPLAAQEAMADRATLEEDLRTLADDAMEGREAGTDGYNRAADYVAGRYAEIGLQPAGDDGTWFQNFELVRTRAARDTSFALVDASGNSVKADYGTDFLGRGTPSGGNGRFEADLVFVGYGLDRPDLGHDDLSGVDLEGNIAVWVYSVPEGLDPLEEQIIQNTAMERFAARGAIGAIMLWTPQMDFLIPWEQGAAFFTGGGRGLTWLGPDGVPGDTARGMRVSLVASTDYSRQMMEGQQVTLDEIQQAMSSGMTPLPSFNTGMRARVSFATDIEHEMETANVIGLLPGTDPSVADQYVVVTAHLDHEGVSRLPLPGGDRIFNGAMDNASGVSTLLEMARLLAADPPRRPILFVSLGAEELGLIGSSYHAANPGLENGYLAANVNVDMPILTWPFSDVVVFGSERSNLLGPVDSAVSEYGLELVPDPNPGEAFFFRSDQYSYVERGIPAAYVDLGFGNGGDVAQTSFLDSHYHQPSDEAHRIDFEQLGRFADISYLIARNVANMQARPGWLPDEYFGRAFGGHIANDN